MEKDAHVWHLFVVRVKKREEFQKYLSENGIQTLIHYPIPPSKQEAYTVFNDLNFPVTENIHKQVLSLPLSGVMAIEEVEKVVDIINSYNV